MSTEERVINYASSANNSVLHLQEILNIIYKTIEIDDHPKSDEAVSELVEFFNSIHGAIVSDPEDEVSKHIAMETLIELLRYLSSPSLDQTVIDALSFELPKSVLEFAGVADKFRETAESIIDRLISTCNPRDMLAVICEVLDSAGEMFKEPAYYIPLLSGLSKVFVSLQRRHFEHIKEALPAVLNVFQAVSSELDVENKESFMDLIGKAICMATSIQKVCQNLEGRQEEKIRALLGLFVLQIVALASSTVVDLNLNVPMMSQLSQFFPFCNLSYLGLVTGDDVDAFTVILGEGNADYLRCFSLIKQGAFIAVVWGLISDEVAKAADEDLTVVKENLQNSQIKRWQTVGMLKYVLSSMDQPWKLKEHAIDFFLYIMEGEIFSTSSKENADCLFYVPSFYSAVQAIEMVMIHAPYAVLRKKAFAALKMVLADIPAHQRFDILKASITNNKYPSMIAILINLVKEEIFMEKSRNGLPRKDAFVLEGHQFCPSSPFWSKDVLELVEFVMKPPRGGPPSLHEESDAVLSALNLYRFLLITESAGKTNFTGVLSENTLKNAYKNWLLPLRTLVSGFMSDKKDDCMAVGDLCALNPLQMVLDRCIELIEDELRHTA